MATADGAAGGDDVVAGEEPEYEEKLDEAPKSILMSMMKQLKGVKKPYNPILGEVFHCKWEYGDQGKGTTYFFSEQVSHHPPISSFFFVNRKRNWMLNVSLRPKSKFLGNSAASIMEGEGYLHILNFGEVYKITFPAYYVRGILIGVMRMEISGDVSISCEQTGLQAELSFKNRGYFSGENNSVDGKIKNSKETLFKIEGRWDRVVTATDKRTKQVEVLFDIDQKRKFFTPPIVAPEAKQQYFESRRVWGLVSQALKSQNIDLATEEKLKLEDGQRAGKKERDESGRTWTPRLFENMSPSDPKSLNWRFKFCKPTPYEGDGELEARFEAEMLGIVPQGELAVGKGLLASLKPG